MIKRSLGFYIACFIGFLLVTSVVGGVLQLSGYLSEAESNYTKESRSRIIEDYAKENTVYTVTKLNMEERGGILDKYYEYFVTVEDGSGKAKTLTVESGLYYSLNVGDKVDYKGNILGSSKE